ncbi:xanthine dehydrogenase family protein molybdopterin-binding subunit [Massilia sp. IC2-476]|uniref:xanthine dehydrogenase family protein molybdopterin-binding subunit n=1 Tax=Massilia sp. IC2-476 TaxID=2887199 RepID=UPI001D126B66|nr:xanthine dehydrogenase family protein molybdopterin-binding subunit [Massilia sp. IC2-476]MCC2972396.1 xanthine dehydrogenase family protein molybdopterin-binding subunit [Massilia sp. IC2-476]
MPAQPKQARPEEAVKGRGLTRRRFLLGGVLAGGALLVGWGVQPPRQRLHTAHPLAVGDDAVALNGWIAIGPDGTVSVVVPRSEMGQGVHTALPMLVAEELDLPLDRVRIVQAPIDKIFANLTVLRENLPFHPDDTGSTRQGAQWLMAKLGRELGIMFTGGSTSVKDAWIPMREAGAVARAMLVKAAAEQWRVPVARLRTEDGFVLDASGRRLGYGALAAEAARVGAGIGAGDVRLKEPRDFRLIGKPLARLDSRAKVDGSARFGIDARVPGMLYAAVKTAPMVGVVLTDYERTAASMPGVLKLVQTPGLGDENSGIGAGVAVLATSWWQARQALEALRVTWVGVDTERLSSETVFEGFARALDGESGYVYHESGTQDVAGVALTVSAEYRAPFLAHAAMEPINCTAQVVDGKVRLWASTQVPSVAVDVAARTAGVDRDDVAIEVMLLGGGFGRRLEVDMVAQAVAVAMAADGKPVQLIWTREQDIQNDVYRPAALARFRAHLDAAGNILAWDNKSASGAIGHQYFPRNLGLPGVGPDKTTAEGEYDMQYAIANQRIAHVIVDSKVALGYWRSVGHSHNAFFKEGFLDEVAHAAKRDGVEFRRALLKEHPRALAVLNAAVARAGQPQAGRAHGVALHRSFGSTVAQVAEVSVEGTTIRVHRVVCAIDCGLVVNPNIVAQQVESGVLFGLSAALHGEITIKEGRVEQSNFGDYPVLRMNEAPHVETIIMPSAEHPEGVGEPAVPPIAPAVASAVFKLTGQRLRSLPLRLA